MEQNLDLMHELSGRLALAAEGVITSNARNFSSAIYQLEGVLYDYNKEVYRLAALAYKPNSKE